MKPLFTFVLGLLIGWLIDYLYWHRRYSEKNTLYWDRPVQANTNLTSVVDDSESRPAVKAPPDDLRIIKGIGPVIERKLNAAGIHTFEQLGNLTPADLRPILGNTIERLANEDSLLQQARDLASRK